MGQVRMAHGRVGARSKGMLVDHNSSVEWPRVGHFRDLLARAARARRIRSKGHRADYTSHAGCDRTQAHRGGAPGERATLSSDRRYRSWISLYLEPGWRGRTPQPAGPGIFWQDG